ncbi:unnamed protein product [Ostreobium quekettii]|uniref:F-box domain-containing protein n=1 Tax=Ostreobium quekettii TaxID=121088 RepID=A0A8S1J482_9CHLO|nr:unnamed protein product [Ostreobium quekettii]|eukprot:evm.model.scf_333.2 EVM.evm.TU.scf_333.2   scf_333:36678-38562(-)
MEGSQTGEGGRGSGGGGRARPRRASPESNVSNHCSNSHGGPPSGPFRRGRKRTRAWESTEGSIPSDVCMDTSRRRLHQGSAEGLSPWQELPFGTLQMIMSELLCMDDGEAGVRRCGCVCRTWRGVSAELLMTDTAASRPPRRPAPPQTTDGGATSLAIVREDDSLSKSVSGGGSEHQSPAFQSHPAHGDQTLHSPGFRMIRFGLDRQARPLQLGHGSHHFSLAGRHHGLHGQDVSVHRVDFREQGMVNVQHADAQTLGRSAPVSHDRVSELAPPSPQRAVLEEANLVSESELAPPSPQRAVLEDMNLISESDAEGGCGLSSLRTGECSEGSARSRPVPQATC